MNIDIFTYDYLNELKCFVAQCDYLPFSGYAVSRDLIANYVVDKISDVFSHGGLVFLSREQKEIIGFIASENLEWDSRHFGFEIGKINYLLASGDYLKSFNTKQKLISHLLKEAYPRLTLHFSVRISKEDLSSIHALEHESFRLMDVLVTYSLELKKQKKVDELASHSIRRYMQTDLPKLIEISLESFRDVRVATDRFHADPVLSKKKSDEVYVKWLTDSIQDPSSEILVAEKDGNITGFDLCSVNKSIANKTGLRLGTIALIAVQPSERNKDVATSLLNASLHWFRDKADIVETGGQVSNYAIQRVWQKTGFRIMRAQCTFHWSILPDNHESEYERTNGNATKARDCK